MKHTPTPWTAVSNAIYDRHGSAIIALCDYPDTKGANAAFIVRACNCHDELVSALKGLLENLKYNEGRGIGAGPRYKAMQAIKRSEATECEST